MHFATISYLLVLFSSIVRCHFVLNYPTSLGFDDENESDGPCGGVDIVFASNDTTVQVDGFAIAMMSTHPASEFLLRATLSKAAPFNWTNLLPVVSETGIGDFCLPSLSAPDSFIGRQGLLQVVQDGPDGLLYQVGVLFTMSQVR